MQAERITPLVDSTAGAMQMPTAPTHLTPRRRMFCATLLLIGLVPGCSSKAPTPPEKPAPNVILIVLDTLRADHLGAYGYHRATSPRLDAFAARSTQYTRSMSTAPWTLPSHASMFTALHPFQHGAHSLKVSRERKKNAYPLDKRHTTLAEGLKQVGYQTAAFVCNIGYLGTWAQLNQGFDVYHVPDKLILAEEMMPNIMSWLDQSRTASTPFFLFVNFMDTHRPYNSKPREGLLDTPLEGHPGKLLTELTDRVMPGVDPVPQDLRQQVIDHYDTAIANLDEQVGHLLDELKSRGLFEESVVIITSDHGEYFGEHTLVEHSKDLYQPAVFVPLLAKAPAQQTGRVEDTPVDSTIVPSLIAAHCPTTVVTALAPLLANRAQPTNPLVQNYYSRTKDLFGKEWSHRFDRIRSAWYDWPYKYISSSDGADELFDLDRDPQELHNLLADQPDLAQRLAGELEKYLAAFEPGATPREPVADHTAAEIEQMRALGYIGGSEPSEEEDPPPPASQPARFPDTQPDRIPATQPSEKGPRQTR